MTTLAFDPDELREKYRAERDKRLRPDGNEQYVEITGQFAHYLDDPYVEPIVREPLFDEVDVVVIGGGFGGLLAGARLKDAGIDGRPHHREGRRLRRHVVLEPVPRRAVRHRVVHLPAAARGDRLRAEGEVHPGARDPRAQPQHRRALRALRRCAVPDRGADVDVGRRRRRAGSSPTSRGDELRARFVCMASGPLHRPKLPGIPGVEGFQGHSFHTSRWDYDYTGGDPDGNLANLAGKRVGIIGTGATAVQVVPHVGAAAEQLYVFQRTPSSIDVRNNRPTDPEWAASLEPGWQKRRMENFNNLVSGIPEPEDLVGDGWTDIIGKLLLRMRQADGEPDSPGGIGQGRRAGRLRQDGTGPCPRRHDRQRPEHGRGAEAVLPAVLQAAVLPRRVPRHVQPAQRHARAHRRPRCRPHHRARCRRRRDGVRDRLPDLRHRLRGRHRLHPSGGLRDHRPGRPDVDREVEGRRVDVARDAHPRLPEPAHLQPTSSPGSRPTSRTPSTSRASTPPTSCATPSTTTSTPSR